jgi:phosphatidylserine/phosphatidylglycerophosphate/cardiolipin synthase-like enzyme
MPDFAVLDALKIAARSGLDVRLMIPDKPDHLLVYPATLSYADELADAGARIFIYRNGFLHARPCWSTTRWARSARPTRRCCESSLAVRCALWTGLARNRKAS